MRDIWRLAWDRFNLVGSIIGDVQGRVLVTAFYFTILLPFGLASRLFSDPLRRRVAETHWLEREPVPTDLESARRQG
ncbi:MAG: hypothetical protein K8L99_33960 [Anaerolineae bacterium]|nr:hypothetical protein [Anaerolineae bacterium]